MKNEKKDGNGEECRLELKYCEHCGGLWLRQCGAPGVYCPKCQPKVEDLPVPRKKPHRAILPVGRSPLVDGYRFGPPDDGMDFEAAGGAA